MSIEKQFKNEKNSLKMKYLYKNNSYNFIKIKRDRDVNGGKT